MKPDAKCDCYQWTHKPSCPTQGSPPPPLGPDGVTPDARYLAIERALDSGWPAQRLEARAALVATFSEIAAALAEIARLRAECEHVWGQGYGAGHSDARFAKWGTTPNPHSTTEAVEAKRRRG